jgi:hypothetical protein
VTPSNYCRQVLALGFVGHTSTAPGDVLRKHYADLLTQSRKFALDDASYWLDQHTVGYRALDDVHELRLPYPCIAVEICSEKIHERLVAVALEAPDAILIEAFAPSASNAPWNWLSAVSVPRTNWKASDTEIALGVHGAHPLLPPLLAARGAWAVLSLLNALACANVKVERVPARKASKKSTNALPFDDYHVLMVEPHGRGVGSATGTGGHRSPREHFRRGHVRRLDDGRNVWVQHTVVATGRGVGVVSKDYKLKPPR